MGEIWSTRLYIGSRHLIAGLRFLFFRQSKFLRYLRLTNNYFLVLLNQSDVIAEAFAQNSIPLSGREC